MASEARKISRSVYLQALGVMTLATRNYSALREYERVLCEMLGDEFNGGAVGDAIYAFDDSNADERLAHALKTLKIEVEE